MEVAEAAAAATRRVHLRTACRPARLLRPRALAALIVAHGLNAQPHLGTPGRHLRRGAWTCNSCSSGCAQRTELRVPRALPTFFLWVHAHLCAVRAQASAPRPRRPRCSRSRRPRCARRSCSCSRSRSSCRSRRSHRSRRLRRSRGSQHARGTVSPARWRRSRRPRRVLRRLRWKPLEGRNRQQTSVVLTP